MWKTCLHAPQTACGGGKEETSSDHSNNQSDRAGENAASAIVSTPHINTAPEPDHLLSGQSSPGTLQAGQALSNSC